MKKNRILIASAICVTLIMLLTAMSKVPTGNEAFLQARVAELEAKVAALEARLAESTVLQLDDYLVLDTTDITRPTARFDGVNLQVVNGAGADSDVPNGLGNIIIGYDQPYTQREGDEFDSVCALGTYLDESSCLTAGYDWAPQHKSGSHNLVVGPGHRYSWLYGIAAGLDDTINNEGSTVIGTRFGVAQGLRAIVMGGSTNRALGNNSVVLGGWGNLASGPASKVVGGVHNAATDQGATVSGGNYNLASGFNSTVSGGNENIASGPQSVVSGGYKNVAEAQYSVVGGGQERSAQGMSDWVAGSLFQDY